MWLESSNEVSREEVSVQARLPDDSCAIATWSRQPQRWPMEVASFRVGVSGHLRREQDLLAYHFMCITGGQR